MERKRLVLEANILIRGCLGLRVRALIAHYADQVDFFVPEANVAEVALVEEKPMPGAMPLLPPSARQKELICRHLTRRSHMATNLALDQDMLDHAFRVSGEPTKKAAVTRALQ